MYGPWPLLLSLIYYAFWAVAVLLFYLALTKPRSPRMKAVAAVTVAVIFGYLPISTQIKSSRWMRSIDAHRLKKLCVDSAPEIQEKMANVDGYFISINSQEHLEITLVADEIFKHFVHHLLDRRMTYLETTFRGLKESSQFRNSGTPDLSDSQFLYFFVARRGDPSCRWFNTWVNEYPRLRWPELRSRGLAANDCIGVKGAQSSVSRYRVNATLDPIEVDKAGYGRWKHTVAIDDTSTGNRIAKFPIIVGHSSRRGYRILCGNNEEAKMFNSSIPVNLNTRIIRPEIIVNDNPAKFPQHTIATPELSQTIPGRRLRIWNRLKMIDELGSTWFEPRYVNGAKGDLRLSGRYLVTLRGNKVYKTLINLDSGYSDAFEGLLVEENEISFVTTDINNRHYLLKYSNKAEPMAVVELDEKNLADLKLNQ